MCWFIAVGVDRESASEFEKLDRERGGFSVWECFCDIVIRSKCGITDKDLEKRRRQYERRGWSQAKIGRALKDARTTGDRAARKAEHQELEVRFKEAVAHHVEAFGRIRLFAHFYNGNQNEETVTFTGRDTVTLPDFANAAIPEGILIEIEKVTDRNEYGRKK